MIKRTLLFLLILCAFLALGCSNSGKNAHVGNWTAISIECEEEDLKNDVLAGNIKVKLQITEDAMIVSANEHTDPPVKYTFKDGVFEFENKSYAAKFEGEHLVLDVTIADHTYSYLFNKDKK